MSLERFIQNEKAYIPSYALTLYGGIRIVNEYIEQRSTLDPAGVVFMGAGILYLGIATWYKNRKRNAEC